MKSLATIAHLSNEWVAEEKLLFFLKLNTKISRVSVTLVAKGKTKAVHSTGILLLEILNTSNSWDR